MKSNKDSDQPLQDKIAELDRENDALRKEIEERNATEAKLKHDSYLLNILMDSFEDKIYFKDLKSRFIAVNQALAEFMGKKEVNDIIGKTDFDYFSEEHASAAFNDEQEIIKNGKPLLGKVEKETWLDGRITWVTTSKMPIRDNLGRITGIVGITRDITELHKAEDRLKESEERSRSLILNLSDMILIVDDKSRIKFASNSSENVLGIPSNQLVETLISDHVHPDDQARMQVEFENVLLNKSDFNPMQLRCKNKKKGWVYLEVVGNNLVGNPGIEGVVITSRDVTERKRAEIEAEKTLLELERSNQELEQFAYAVSHDLQEPLRKVKSFAELLSDRYSEYLDEKAGTYIEHLVDGSRRMQILIQDLLSYSRIITKGEPFSQVDSEKLLKDALNNVEMAIQEAKAKVSHDKLPLITADGGQITRLFQNLLSNAIKFRGDQPPVIQIKSEKLKHHWKFTISDNGIGIDPKYSDRIFKVFQRLHTRTEFPGTGVGLALCKKIVERHGGEILVDSEAGKGATFIFTISASL